MLWTICLALTLAGIGALPTLGSHDATGACRLVAVQVQPSESLWSLAAAHPEPGLSTAAVVDRIARLNALADARLHPGQRLVLPLSTAGGHALAQLGSPDSSH